MNTNFLKKALPIGVGMMAVAFAFATEGNSSTKSTEYATAYIYNDLEECEEVDATCNNIGTVSCTVESKEVFQFKNGTQCSQKLMHWQP